MSKEIAQTVGGKRIAWLIAILAAFAVFATVSLPTEGARGANAPPGFDRQYSTTAALILNKPDALTTGQSAGTESAAFSTSSDPLIELFDGVLSSLSGLKDRWSVPGNPWHAVAVPNGSTAGSSPDAFYGKDVGFAVAPSSCLSWTSCESAGFADKNVPAGPYWNLLKNDGVMDSAIQPGIRPTAGNPQSETVTHDRSGSAAWLYAVLGLGALAFGVGGAAVARRSR